MHFDCLNICNQFSRYYELSLVLSDKVTKLFCLGKTCVYVGFIQCSILENVFCKTVISLNHKFWHFSHFFCWSMFIGRQKHVGSKDFTAIKSTSSKVLVLYVALQILNSASHYKAGSILEKLDIKIRNLTIRTCDIYFLILSHCPAYVKVCMFLV